MFKILSSLILCVCLVVQIECKFNIQKLFNDFKSGSGKLGFSYKNCGPASDPFQVSQMSALPDPLRLPGNVTASGSVNVIKVINGPLTMSLKVIKIIGPIKIEIPCVDNVGSCTYPDVCALLPGPDACPDFFIKNNIPCSCPFKTGDYAVENLQVEIDLPEKIPNGQYTVTVNFSNQELGHVSCLNIGFNLA